MMSNCAFWSEAGELVAVHGEGAPDPMATFGPWAKMYRLPAGRLVALSGAFGLSAPGPGWHLTTERPPARHPRAVAVTSPIAVAAPALDGAASLLLPPRFDHEQFTLRAWPTWVTTARPEGEGPEGWFAALDSRGKHHRFLVRLVPHRGHLPGHGWRNMLAWTLKEHAGVRLAVLNGLPTPAALNAAPAWEYRVEAGRGDEAAAWDVQLLPTRGQLAEWAQGITDPWEATALLRWVRPGTPPSTEPEPTWAGLLSRLPATDVRLLVQNVLTTLPGGAASAAALLFDSIVLSSQGRSLVRHVPEPGLPLSLLSVLFGRRAWHEIERARRQPPSEAEKRRVRAETLADLDLRLAEGRLRWSEPALAVWDAVYRLPMRRALEAELETRRRSVAWGRLLSDPRTLEFVLRRLDVTDAAICLAEAPDQRWRRCVTARREAELREEFAFVRVWRERGELTVERELDAWREWERLQAELPLTESDGTN